MEEPGLPLARWPQVLRGSALNTQTHFVQGNVEKNPTRRIKRKICLVRGGIFRKNRMWVWSSKRFPCYFCSKYGVFFCRNFVIKKKKNPLKTKPKTTTYIGTRERYETQIHILMAAYPQPSVSQQRKNKFTHLCMCSNTEVAEISLQFSRLESLGTPKLWFLVAGGLQIT